LISATNKSAVAPAGRRGRSAPRAAFAGVLAIGLFTGVGGTAFGQSGETQYVIEQLVVSVNATADGSGDRVGQIKSGDPVELLERQADQSRVRLPAGEEGWVRTSYLSSTPPLREQLKARTEELEKLRQEKTRLEADLASARKAANAAVTSAPASKAASSPVPPMANPAQSAPAAETTPESTPAEAAAADAVQSSNPPLFSSEDMVPSRPSWMLALVAAVATLVIGFALGWRMLDRRIRAKYGGLRIY
jgi:SH3 domain protein